MSIPEDNKIQEYRLAIEKLAITATNYVFTNSGEVHACIVMSNIFKVSTSHINIFAGNLKGVVSTGQYLIELENYLKAGKKLNVLLEEQPDEKNPSAAIGIIKKYRTLKPDNISISVANKQSLEKSKINNKNNHFTIGDDRMFRFETDVENYTAVCNFNDPVSCERLNARFNTLSIDSTPLN